MNREKVLQEKQRLQAFFERGKTRRWDYRLRQLSALEKELLLRKNDIYQALKDDLNKCTFESSIAEMGMVIAEIHTAKKNLRRWMRPKRVRASLSQMPGRAAIYPEPYGVVLILSPWNYPLQLALSPLIAAIAAGNCAVVKPSAYAPNTSRVLCEIIAGALPDTAICIEGGREENEALLSIPFDYIFFTGSTGVGKAVLRAAAEHLTPVTLELGGKSPSIIDASADIEKTAKRLLFGKLINAGQTCIAPDFLWVHESVKEELIERLRSGVGEMLTDGFESQWVRIVSEKQRKRLEGLLADQKNVWQHPTKLEEGHFPFTIVENPSWESALMKEEIFGPILPILSFEKIEEVIAKQRTLEKPLALYLFTNEKKTIEKVVGELSFGGGCINDTLMHLASPKMPFGGVGASGMGSYHGKAGFDTFSHFKSVLHKSWLLDIPMRYLPYKRPQKEFWLRLMR